MGFYVKNYVTINTVVFPEYNSKIEVHVTALCHK